MAMTGYFPSVALAVLVLVSSLPAVTCACEGNLCEEQTRAGRAHGLLGSSVSRLATCTPKTYPTTGSLLPVTIDTRILDIQTVNVTADGSVQHVYAITEDRGGFAGGHLWRSEDPAQADAWRDITSMLTDLLPGKASPYFGISSVLVAPGNHQHVFLKGRTSYHFASRDGGKTFTAVAAPGGSTGFTEEIKWHPTQGEWLLSKSRRPHCSWFAAQLSCGYDLFITQDFGGSWTNLTANSAGRISSFRDFEWGAVMPRYAGKPTPDEAIFATVYPSAAGSKSLYPGWDKDLHYVVSLDLFKTPAQRTVPCGNLFEVVAGKVYLAVPSDCPLGADGRARTAPKRAIAGRSVTLYVSDGDGDDFTEVCLPSNLEDDGYNMIHTHDQGAAFVLADHAEPGSAGPTTDSPTSDAYAPAYNASLHTLSLRNVYRADYLVDFLRVEDLPGMFIANHVDPETVKSGISPINYGQHLQTRLTADGGGSWSALPAPRSFRFAQCNACPTGSGPEACSLHLHGPTSWASRFSPRPSLYSVPGAPGLLLATGNVGSQLSVAPGAAACTWSSSDGGLTWQDVADRPLIYEIGGGGDVVVAAGHASDGPTAAVRVSLDGGGCWHTVSLPEAVLVDNVRVVGDMRGTVFFVHGTACTHSSRRPDCTFQGGMHPPGKLFVIDVPALMGPADARRCADADYERWAAPGPGGCLLGASREFERRKADAACVTPADRARAPPVTTPCDCRLDGDTECEYGFERPVGNASAPCAPIQGLEGTSCPRWNADGGYAASASHLRLVHADVCADSRAVIPDTDGKGGAGGNPAGGGGCHGKGGGGRWVRAVFVTVLVVGVCAVVAGVAWGNCLTPAARDAWAERAAPAAGALSTAAFAALDGVIAAWDWARFKYAELTHRGAARDAYFEPLADQLELDPEDRRSPPTYDGP